MTKLYRLIPDSVATTCYKGFLSGVNEDLFYELGYISVGNHSPYYFSIKNDGNSWAINVEEGVFFFTSPWSCLINLKYLNDPYCRQIGRICEYEIPDKLFKNIPKGTGYYARYGYEEVVIPFSVLEKNTVVEHDVDDELKNKLYQLAINQVKQTFPFIEDSVINNNFSCFTSRKEEILNGSLKKWFLDPELIDHLVENRLEKPKKYFKSNIITGKSTIITKNDLSAINNLLNYVTEKDVKRVRDLLSRSNGIFDTKNLKEFLVENDTTLKIDLKKLEMKPKK